MKFNGLSFLALISVLSIYDSAFAGGTVTIFDEASLRAALVGGGSVTFAASGTIVVTNTLIITNNTTIDGSGQTVAISGNGCRVLQVNTGVTLTLLNLTVQNGLSNQGGGLYNDSGNIVMSNCVFQGNTALGIPGSGGGVYNNGGSIVISNCTFFGNHATGASTSGSNFSLGDAYGGAVYTTNGSLNGWNCYFTNNAAMAGYDFYGLNTYNKTPNYRGTAYGGTIFAGSSSVALSSGAIVDGSANGVPTAGGGIFQINGTLTLSNVVVMGAAASSDVDTYYYPSDGRPAQGGGVCGINTVATLTDCQLIANSASGGKPYYASGPPNTKGGTASGGGIYCIGSLKLNRCTVASNIVAGAVYGEHEATMDGGDVYGAGVFSQGNQLNLVNCTIAGNSGRAGDGSSWIIYGAGGAAYGGGVFSISAQTTLTNCTLATNQSISGLSYNVPVPPVRVASNGGNIAGIGIQLINTILSGGISNNAYGTLTDLGHNLSSDASCNFTNVGSLNNTNPRLGPLANNGGLTPTMALMPDSPAIDAGVALPGIGVDQRGVARPYDGAPDMGAYEWNATSFYPPFQLSGPVRTNGHWGVLAVGPADVTLRLQRSSDLRNWSDVSTNSSGTGSVFIEDADASDPIRFYRIASP